MDKKSFCSPEQYPEVVCTSPCKHDIAILQPLYSGTHSELTAILKYSYQNTVLSDDWKEICDTLHGISIVEMHHLHMLAEAICKLGGDPRYVNPSTRSWWNAGAVNYSRELCKALLVNLRDETDTHRSYLEAARRVKNPSVAALLRRIALDERLHMEIFTKLINVNCRKRLANQSQETKKDCPQR